KRRTLLPAPWNARSRVHEYGGRSYLPVPIGEKAEGSGSPAARPAAAPRAIVFANYADQRLYPLGETTKSSQGQPPPAATPEAGGIPGNPSLRYADFTLSPDQREVWCVRERHEEGKVTRAIVAVPLDGSAAEDGGAVRELVTGSDFYAFPTLS